MIGKITAGGVKDNNKSVLQGKRKRAQYSEPVKFMVLSKEV